MNKFAITACAAMSLASSAFAGHEMAPTGKGYEAPVDPCFKDQEIQLDLFGSWVNTRQEGSGFGGGIGVNFFFHRYFGVGVDGNLVDVSNGLWTVSGSLIGRYPLELGGVCIAPYALIGGGGQWNGHSGGTMHAGGGLEWRATPAFGVFAEGRYTWEAGSEGSDNARVSMGVRFVF
jgi:hypothetical protein